MKPNKIFLNQDLSFWANVRAIGETCGYTERGKGTIKIPTLEDMMHAMRIRNLNTKHLTLDKKNPTKLGHLLLKYFRYRAEKLNNYVEPRLMTKERAMKEYEKLITELKPPECLLPMNKQKGDKKSRAYLTCMVNMIINKYCQDFKCDYDPRSLTTITSNEIPLRTLARRVDGAFPSTVNPVAIWEIKEYYYTTTFVSRVADGVYETLLDGMELIEIHNQNKIKILHYLIVDAHYTWWECGKSYLCRIFDTMHMGYIDEVLFGYEVIERLPQIVRNWVKIVKQRKS
jgi:hypothetical protein